MTHSTVWRAFLLFIAGVLVFSGASRLNARVITASPADYRALLKTLKPGDTLKLTAGNYPRLVLDGLNGAPDRWILVTGPVEGSPAVIVGNPKTNTVEILNSSYLAIEHLRIDSRGIPGAFGVSAKGGTSNRTHNIRIANNLFIGQNGGQQTVAISTKVPTWGWVIRNNTILGAGTGMYLGDSDGTQPFVNGLIEDNLVKETLGYNLQIKHQIAIPDENGIPQGPTSTIIRNNVFIRNDQRGPDGDRPNVLVGAQPESGPGSLNVHELYGNVFFRNHHEALFQGAGRVSLHDNLFTDGPFTYPAVVLRSQAGMPLKAAHVYNNTVFTSGKGIYFGSRAVVDDSVMGNLIFAVMPISGNIMNKADNIVDLPANASRYVVSPSFDLATMDFSPLPGKCRGTPLDLSLFHPDTDYTMDFDGVSKISAAGAAVFRGAYAGERQNSGWLKNERKKLRDESSEPPAVVVSADPGTGSAGSKRTVTLTGAWFTPESTLKAGDDITVESLEVLGTTKITAVLRIAVTAKPGVRNLIVSTQSGSSNAFAFRVGPGKSSTALSAK